MKKLLSITLLSLLYSGVFCQSAMHDTASSLPAEDFLGLRFIIADYNMNTLNEDLHFNYVSQSQGYVMSHDMNLSNMSNAPHFGIGVDETMGKHVLLNFINLSIGTSHRMWDWTIGIGGGYTTSLNKKNNLMLKVSANAYFQNITYGLGSYTDSTLLGFVINGVNIGTFVKNIKYVNNAFCVDPAIELLYRTNSWDFFIRADYSYTLFYKEKLDFYQTHISIGNGIYDQSGNTINQGAIKPGNYILQIGIVKEFEL